MDIKMPARREPHIIDNLGETAEIIPYRYSITSYGVDFPVDGIINRMNKGDMFIPSFQRQFVWTPRQCSRFIESLLLGLPVPGIFLAKEREGGRFLIIDGQQRMSSLFYFYQGYFPDAKEFALRDVQSKYLGATYQTLDDDDRRQLDDSLLHATIVQQDQPSGDDSSIFHLFERLNTGGVKLEPQEIRACIYHGPFNDLLKKLNHITVWRALFGPPSRKARDQELILRFLALEEGWEEYQKPMKEFLNRFMGDNRHLDKVPPESLVAHFIDTLNVIYDAIGPKAFRPKGSLNAAVIDSVMVGVSRRLRKGPITDLDTLQKAYQEVIGNSKYIEATETGTAQMESVYRRMSIAQTAFSQVV